MDCTGKLEAKMWWSFMGHFGRHGVPYVMMCRITMRKLSVRPLMARFADIQYSCVY